MGSNIENPIRLEFFNSVPRKWAKIDLPKQQEAAFKQSHDMLVNPADVNRPPHQLFDQFFDDDVIEYLCQQANLYVSFNGKMTFTVGKDEKSAFIAILLRSGYSVVPRRQMMWQRSEDVHSSAVSQLKNRDRFDEILRYLHHADNNNLAACDKLAKVRPFYEMINERFLKPFQLEENLCIEKALISYYGKCSAKQYIKKTPIKFGYKLCCLNSHLGYLVQCEPYSRKIQTVPARGLGGSVVTKLMKLLPENLSFQVRFDNFFISLNLLKCLRGKDIGAKGTLRANRTVKCPIIDQKEMAKKVRGTMDYCYNCRHKME